MNKKSYSVVLEPISETKILKVIKETDDIDEAKDIANRCNKNSKYNRRGVVRIRYNTL